jgi:hypothetical protein
VKRLLVTLAIAAAFVALPVYAHHSFAAHYFEDQLTSIEGELADFEYRSPHAWVHVMVKDASGEMQQYSAEWSNPNRLTQQKITKDTLKPGDYVIVRGSPGRNTSERKLHLKGIERPADGWRWGNAQGSRR